MTSSPEPTGGPPKRDHWMVQLGKGWTYVIEFLGYMLVLGYIGYRLDQRYGWDGMGLMGGLALALTAWVYRVIRQSRGLFK